MNVFDYLLLLAFFVVIVGALDHLWLCYVRPALAERHGWPDVPADARIPPMAWLGIFAVLCLLGFFAFIGHAAGLDGA